MLGNDDPKTLAKGVEAYGGRHLMDFVDEADPDGGRVVHGRITTQTPVARLCQEHPGVFEPRHLQASEEFRAHFENAGLTPNYASLDIEGLPGLDKSASVTTESQYWHRDKIAKLLGRVGKLEGNVLWYVVGAAEELERYVWRFNQAGLNMDIERARALLRDGLESLADAWGY